MKLTKLEAAQRQLDTAAKLFVIGGDRLSLHTLAGAAEEILGKKLERAGSQNMFDQMRRYLEARLGKKVAPAELSRLVNKSRNSLKHANDPDDDAFDYDPDHAVVMLYRAMVNFQLLCGSLTDTMEVALKHLERDYPSLMQTNA